MIEIRILDGSVMQQQLLVIPECVRCLSPHEGVALQGAPQMPG